MIVYKADVMDLNSRRGSKTEATVIESKVDKRLGTVATILVKSGELKVGDIVLVGPAWGRVRRLLSDQGKDLTSAGPSTPVQVFVYSYCICLQFSETFFSFIFISDYRLQWCS